MQEERRNKPVSTSEGTTQSTKNEGNESRWGMSASDLFGDDESSTMGGFNPAIRMNVLLTLLPLLVFLGIDVIYLVILPIPIMFLPLIVHAVFLPWAYIESRKMRQQEEDADPGKRVLQFLLATTTYMVVYIGLKIVVSLLIGDFFSLIIFMLFGMRAVFSLFEVRAISKAIEDE